MEGDSKPNWNAGAEFNDLVGLGKSLILQNINNPIGMLDILSNDLDFTYMKIKLEAAKRKKDVSKNLEDLRKEILGIYDDLGKYYTLGDKGTVLLKVKLVIFRRKLWDLQGQFGVLFPIADLKTTWEETVMEEYDINEKDMQTP